MRSIRSDCGAAESIRARSAARSVEWRLHAAARMRRLVALLAALFVLSLGGSARAKRELPDYDGRGSPPATVGDGALWIPRVVVAPLWLVSEYVLRRPIGALVVAAERNHWPMQVMQFFTFDREQKSGVIPTGLVDFGLRPSAGLYFFWDDVGGSKHALRAHAATWGRDWLKLTLTERYALDERTTAAVRAEWIRRSDNIFHGLGPRTVEEDRTRYSADKLDVRAMLEHLGPRSSSVMFAIGERAFRGRTGICCDDYAATYQRIEWALDSRRPRPAPGSGVRLELLGEHGVDLAHRRSFVRYGGSLGGALAVDGAHRVLGLTVTALFADPLNGDVPVPEWITLGGMQLMRGYLPGRLYGRSALVAAAQYTWPIWVFLDGALVVEAGNVFSEHLSDFDPKLLRLSATLGLRSVGSPDHRFELLTGVGTETIEDHLRVTSIRILFGGTHGL